MKTFSDGEQGKAGPGGELPSQPTFKKSPNEGTKGVKRNMDIDPNLLLAKMNDKDDDKTLWLFLLLLLYGKGGLGQDGQGVRDDATLADLNAAQNAINDNIRGAANAINERTLDITRDQAANALRNETGQRDILATIQACCNNLLQGQCGTRERIDSATFAISNGQKDLQARIQDCCCQLGLSVKDIEKAVCDCCCQLGIGQKELQNALERCCCETQNKLQYGFAQVENAICNQTNVLERAVHSDGEATRALITQNRMDDLQGALQVERDRNSNLQQTAVIGEKIDQAVKTAIQHCIPHHPHGNGGGNGGMDIGALITVIQAMNGGNGGPPGPPKK
jgi:hypothetical protein